MSVTLASPDRCSSSFALPARPFVVASALIAWMLKSPLARTVLDHPNERSLHVAPVPRTGGLAIMIAIAFAGIALLPGSLVWLAPTAALAALSFVDDLRGLPVTVWLRLQIAVGHLRGVGAGGIAAALDRRGGTGDRLACQSLQLHGRLRRPRGRHGAIGFGCTGSPRSRPATRPWRRRASASPARRPPFWSSISTRRASSWATSARSRSASSPRRSACSAGGRAGRCGSRCSCSRRSSSTRPSRSRAGCCRGDKVWQAHKDHYYQRLVRLGLGHRRTALTEYSSMLARRRQRAVGGAPRSVGPDPRACRVVRDLRLRHDGDRPALESARFRLTVAHRPASSRAPCSRCCTTSPPPRRRGCSPTGCASISTSRPSTRRTSSRPCLGWSRCRRHVPRPSASTAASGATRACPISKRIVLAVGRRGARRAGARLHAAARPPVPRSVLIMDPVLLLLIMGGSRILYRAWKERRLYNLASISGRPVLVLGAGDAAVTLIKELARSTEWRVVGLLDDDARKAGRSCRGNASSARSPSSRTGRASSTWSPRSSPCRARATRSAGGAVEICTDAGVKVLTVPSIDDLVSGKVTVSADPPRRARRPARPRSGGARHWPACTAGSTGASCMVTGAGGSIGSELCRQIARFEPRAAGAVRAERVRAVPDRAGVSRSASRIFRSSARSATSKSAARVDQVMARSGRRWCFTPRPTSTCR